MYRPRAENFNLYLSGMQMRQGPLMLIEQALDTLVTDEKYSALDRLYTIPAFLDFLQQR